jgi:isocitrate dehydrogenase
MEKIKMPIAIAEIDGDEMTRVLWADIKRILIEPYVELNTEYYDLGLPKREQTGDQITIDAANAIKRLRVSVKCATITPNAERVKEYNLTKMWKSPNATLRAMLDGTVFREPVLVDGIAPLIPNWKKPITIARHAYGDVYGAVEALVESGKAEVNLPNGQKLLVKDFEGGGVVQAMHNTDKSIKSFAKACFVYALNAKQDLWFSTKDTISKIYDRRFRDIFNEVYEAEFKTAFQSAGIEYFYTLIDDAVARIMRSKGGMLWACKNYDGDVMSDMLASCFGSLAMMSSVLVSPDGCYEYEAAHGTVTQHYYRYLKGEETSTNPVATIFAWAGALSMRGKMDNNSELENFGNNLKYATLDVIEKGIMTKDLLPFFKKEDKFNFNELIVAKEVNSAQFLNEIAKELSKIYK